MSSWRAIKTGPMKVSGEGTVFEKKLHGKNFARQVKDVKRGDEGGRAPWKKKRNCFVPEE